jgi:predicted ATP-dependent protease
MGGFVDIIRQADFWAGQDGAQDVRAVHVERALEELEYRSALVRDRMQQMIDDGSLYIATSGEAVGQINALSVYDVGDMSFGRPSRITCVTGAGRGTIVNIERETEMSGRIHNKGFMILRGFLAARFGQDRAMSLHASLTFEQLYGEIDGDSASSTELYALLSSLSGLPIKQSIAVTGSVNQHGEVQPIGGATAKVEGFYEVCRERGLDGTQGVMIPSPNVPNVVLRPEVAQAIADGQFNVWAVSTIEQGIELLTGVAAGTRAEDGKYPEGSVFRRVEDRLDEFEAALRSREAGPTETPHAAPVPSQPPTPPGVPPPPPPPPPIQV